MTEYIDRDMVDVMLCDLMREYNRAALGRESSAVFEALARFRYLPAANVRENVKMRWIWDDEGYHCSECMFHAYGMTGEILTGQFNFCPWCGAQMGGAEDGYTSRTSCEVNDDKYKSKMDTD